MKFSAFAIVLMPIAAQACANYQFCHCYDSNGIPNYKATKQVCDGIGAENGAMQGPSLQSNTDECRAAIGKTHNNCSWRQWCQLAGATGADSSCREKKK